MEAIQENQTITHIDMRMCGLEPTTVNAIKHKISENRTNNKLKVKPSVKAIESEHSLTVFYEEFEPEM